MYRPETPELALEAILRGEKIEVRVEDQVPWLRKWLKGWDFDKNGTPSITVTPNGPSPGWGTIEIKSIMN